MAAPKAAVAHFESLRGLQGLDGACGCFGPVETERRGLPQPLVWRLAGFERLDAFGALCLARKRKTWLATALSLAADDVHTKGVPRRRPGHG